MIKFLMLFWTTYVGNRRRWQVWVFMRLVTRYYQYTPPPLNWVVFLCFEETVPILTCVFV